MANVRNYTDDQILNRVEANAEGFVGWYKGFYLIGVRSKEDKMDAFDDKFYLYEVPQNNAVPKFIKVFSGTTNAGSYGLKQFSKYNKAGCAVLKSDRIVYNSHTFGGHKWDSKRQAWRVPEAYRQQRGFPYFRDNDKDNKAEEIGIEHNNVIHANIHPAAKGKVSTRIYNWSVACMVLNDYSEWEWFIEFMKSKKKPDISLCILKEFEPKTTKIKNSALPIPAEKSAKKLPINTTIDLEESKPEEMAEPNESEETKTKIEQETPGGKITVETETKDKFDAYIPQINTAKKWLKWVGGGTIFANVGAWNLSVPYELKILMGVLLVLIVAGGLWMFIKYSDKVFEYVTKMNSQKTGEPVIKGAPPRIKSFGGLFFR